MKNVPWKNWKFPSFSFLLPLPSLNVSSSPHPFIFHLYLILSATPCSQASLVSPLWEESLRHRLFSILVSLLHLQMWSRANSSLSMDIWSVGNGLQLQKLYLCTLLSRLLLFLSPWRTSVLLLWTFQSLEVTVALFSWLSRLKRSLSSLRQPPQLLLHFRIWPKHHS